MSNNIKMSIEGNNNTQSIKFNIPDPLFVDPDDLRDLIIEFRRIVPVHKELEKGYFFNGIKEKNIKNKMDDVYFKTIVEDDLPYFRDIDIFLHDPRSSGYAEMYNATAKDLQMIFLSNQDKFDTIHSFFSYSYGVLFKGLQSVIRRERGKIRTFLHHMYWHCSVGIR